MKVLAFTIALSVACAATGLARVGDDEKQIESLYGKAAKVLDEKGNFRQAGYTAGAFAVVVDFVNGISRREGFAKPDTSPLTPEDIQQILSVSAANGTTWKETVGQAGDKKWDRSDNKAVAIFPARGTYLVVQDVAYVQPE
ncbi:MAG TPA: hypothetical protein VM717_06025 [Chthoniobacterales bacterium]|jgi:hypothetical protein|nr:hypothetical protein [Chthoniobacterales bacterium]